MVRSAGGIRIWRAAAGVLALVGRAPLGLAQEPAPPLAQIKDEKQLAEALSAITQDPAVRVDDPAMRPLAQALMIEGVKQLQARAHDQALANFLEAYGKFPSPKILLNIASTLRDMGRLADAANTYQRYLLDPATGPERVTEVKELLIRLDEQLTTLTVRVKPSGSDISIDGGPFLPVGSSLVTRVRPGLHLVRIRKADQSAELTVNGFEGETKLIEPELPAAPDVQPPIVEPVPTQGWLTTGTQYGTGATSNQRTLHAGFSGPTIRPILPAFDITDTGDVVLQGPREPITSGLIAMVRIDGKLRGFAVGAGIAIARGRLEGDLLVLRSDITGGYLGARYRLLTGWLRPYVAVGVPGFLYEQMDDAGNTSTKLAVGLRVAAGIELMINGHLSVQADAGYEHFFGLADTIYDADVFVPTVGVIGRL
jgi:opacity protein-like surface antigen